MKSITLMGLPNPVSNGVYDHIKSLEARILELEVMNGQLSEYLSTAEDNATRYREALEKISTISSYSVSVRVTAIEAIND